MTFMRRLETHKGETVEVVTNTSLTGVLTDVQTDHVTLEVSPTTIVYVPFTHISAFGKSTVTANQNPKRKKCNFPSDE